MIRREIHKSWLIEAKENAEYIGKLPNSITDGDGNIAGRIGERMVLDYLMTVLPGAKLVNGFDYDIEWNGLKIEVKTKRTRCTPEEWYDCSVAKYNQKQKCDIYVFCRVIENCKNTAIEDYSVGWILGWLTPEEFYGSSKEIAYKENDPSNNYNCKAACNNVKISDLHDMEELIKCVAC